MRRRTTAARILIVEDSDDLRLLMEMALSDEGYSVDGVSTAEDAVERLTERRYHLVLTDYSLPGHSGTWLLSAGPRGVRHEIPSLIITGDPDAPGIPDDMMVIKKPIDFDALLGRIHALLADSAPIPQVDARSNVSHLHHAPPDAEASAP